MARVNLYAYQKKWIADPSRFKLGLWSRQVGKTFATTLEAVIDSFARKALWIILSRGERQSKEAVNQCAAHAKVISKAMIATAAQEGTYRVDDAEYKISEILFPNGSRIIGLPANPDTARGWSGNVILDEFAFHKDSRSIWRALFPTITRGYKIRIISTPQGKSNKFYELYSADNGYSKHKIDIYEAVSQGFVLLNEKGEKTSPEELRKGLGDEEAWAQEYMVEFLDEVAAFLTYDLINAVESDEADFSPDWAKALLEEAKESHRAFLRTKVEDYFSPAHIPSFDGDLYLGMDIARRRDLSVIWLDEMKENVAWTRAVIELFKQPFYVQKRVLFSLLAHPKMRRACIDQTGLGMQLAEEARERFGEYKVEGIDFTPANKEAIATGLKQNLEDLQSRLPVSQTVRNSLHSVKKYQTSTGHFRFDADKTDETGHADHFWAKALATQAASKPAGKTEYRSVSPRRFAEMQGAY